MNQIGQHITGLQHIGLPTNDLEGTVKFYEKLGFRVASRTASGDMPVCFMKLQNICMEIFENKQAAMKSGAIDHLAFDVDDIEAEWKAVRAAGLEIREKEIQELPFWEHGIRFFTLEGPNREVLEFNQIL